MSIREHAERLRTSADHARSMLVHLIRMVETNPSLSAARAQASGALTELGGAGALAQEVVARAGRLDEALIERDDLIKAQRYSIAAHEQARKILDARNLDLEAHLGRLNVSIVGRDENIHELKTEVDKLRIQNAQLETQLRGQASNISIQSQRIGRLARALALSEPLPLKGAQLCQAPTAGEPAETDTIARQDAVIIGFDHRLWQLLTRVENLEKQHGQTPPIDKQIDNITSHLVQLKNRVEKLEESQS